MTKINVAKRSERATKRIKLWLYERFFSWLKEKQYERWAVTLNKRAWAYLLAHMSPSTMGHMQRPCYLEGKKMTPKRRIRRSPVSTVIGVLQSIKHYKVQTFPFAFKLRNLSSWFREVVISFTESLKWYPGMVSKIEIMGLGILKSRWYALKRVWLMEKTKPKKTRCICRRLFPSSNNEDTSCFVCKLRWILVTWCNWNSTFIFYGHIALSTKIH